MKTFIDLAIEQGFETMQVFKVTENSFCLDFEMTTLKSSQQDQVTTYDLKGVYQGKLVGLKTESLEEYHYLSLLEELKSQAIVLDQEAPVYFEREAISPSSPNQTDVKNSKRLVEEVQVLLKKQDLANINTLSGTLSCQNKIYEIANNWGLTGKSASTSYTIDFDASSGKDKISHVNHFYKTPNLEIAQIESLLHRTISEVKQNEVLVPVPTGIYQVLLDSSVIRDILEAVVKHFAADNISNHTSLLEGKEGNLIFSKVCTLIEDPTNQNLVGYRTFDDEGVKTKKKVLVEQGVLQMTLHNLTTSAKEKKQATGNGYGTISVRNLYLNPGEKTKEELLEEMHNGLYITTCSGIHSGIDHTNGTISIPVTGNHVIDGKIGPAFEPIILTTDFFTFFQNVIAVANDLTSYSSVVSSPSVLLKDIKLIGNA